jgi:aryl-alcohol dehydrogenase
MLIELQAQGRFPYQRLVTAYPFAKINQAIADARSGAAIKPVLVMPA